jgi:hypothetical protein
MANPRRAHAASGKCACRAFESNRFGVNGDHELILLVLYEFLSPGDAHIPGILMDDIPCEQYLWYSNDILNAWPQG